MICPSCNNGILSPSLPVPLVLTYRSFKKVIGTSTSLDCSSCLYESTGALNSSVDVDAEMLLFKREVNSKLSGGEL